MKRIMFLLKKMFNVKKYYIEYKVNNRIYNFIVKGSSEEEAIKIFDSKWNNSILGIYPYIEYKILSIRQLFNKIEVN